MKNENIKTKIENWCLNKMLKRINIKIYFKLYLLF